MARGTTSERILTMRKRQEWVQERVMMNDSVENIKLTVHI